MKKQSYYTGIIAICIVLLIGAFAYFPIAQTKVTWEGILPGVSSELGGTYGINVAMIQSTVGSDISEESSVTNTLYEVESVTHTTSGTPATSIGVKKTWTQECGAGNEDVGYIGFEMTDVTDTSEDASFVVGTMAAGATASQVLEVGSTGIVEFVGGATADNATAATELNITETNIQLTGALDLEGGNVKINEDSGDYDFAIETDSTDNAFSIDSGASTLDTNGVTVTFNQGGGDYNFAVESDGNAQAIFVDAGNNYVGIMNASPGAELDVTGDIVASDDVTVGGWFTIPTTTVAASAYTITSTGKSSAYIIDYTDTGDANINLPDSAADGTVIWIKDGDLNANTNNLYVAPNGGGSDTIDEAAIYTIDADGESVMFLYDAGGTDWNVMIAYGE